jgi:hypothetical protein
MHCLSKRSHLNNGLANPEKNFPAMGLTLYNILIFLQLL